MTKYTAPKRFTSKNIPTITVENIRSMGKYDLIRLANAYQREFRRRVRSFKGHYSYAEDVLRTSMKNTSGTRRVLDKNGRWREEYYENKPFYKTFSKINKKRLSQRTEKVGGRKAINELRSYAYKMAKFFNPGYQDGGLHTNTLEGILENEKRLNRQIFGITDNGDPRKLVDEDTLKMLYRTYNEFIHSYIGEGTYDSNDVMSAIGILYETGNLSIPKSGVSAEDLKKLSLLYKSHREHDVDLYEPMLYSTEDDYVENAKDLVHQVFHTIEPNTTIHLDDGISLEVTGPFVANLKDDDAYPL